jgi:hypothetical protein
MPVHIMAKPVQTAAVTVDVWVSAAETIAAPVRGIFSRDDDHVCRFRRMNSLQTDHVSHATVMSAVLPQGRRHKDAHRYLQPVADIVDNHVVGSVFATMTARRYATIHDLSQSAVRRRHLQ